ncbi:E3 ubiquitin-protein ligase Zswim2-like [Bemisia tabaci]|uniref:E3 ubiquitin-protein ligase Zswim2-like n=1 Tax=Bemisia tabaci TaxID=7038 RepID=UPI003B27DA62
MSRVGGWRSQCPIPVRELQLKTYQDHYIFLLRQNGPAAFTIQQGRQKPFEVRLGNPHSCTCKEHTKMQELCMHICWVLLRKLRLKPEDSLSYQLGMTSGELNHFLSGKTQLYATPSTHKQDPLKLKSQEYELSTVPKRLITADDVCPICLETFSVRNSPVVHCKHGCGNGVHVRCMAVVVKHQLDAVELEENTKLEDHILTCPMCRGHFGRNGEFQREAKRLKLFRVRQRRNVAESPIGEHPELVCCACAASPIIGRVYRCNSCPQMILCSGCIRNDQYTELHITHGFASKKVSFKTHTVYLKKF